MLSFPASQFYLLHILIILLFLKKSLFLKIVKDLLIFNYL